MKNIIKIASLVLATILMFTACGVVPIQNISTQKFQTAKKVTSNDVYKAIKVAGLSKGWIVKKIEEGKAQATLNLRKHQAVVLINYDKNSYDMNYISSLNLASDGKNIHKNYNGWIGYLKQAIDAQLSSLSE